MKIRNDLMTSGVVIDKDRLLEQIEQLIQKKYEQSNHDFTQQLINASNVIAN